MRRRRFIAALGGTATTGIAGCATPEGTTGEQRHPFADETVRVRIADESETPHDVTEITRRALDYWTEHGERYAGFPVRFEVVADDPDLAVRFVDRPDDCHMVESYSERVLGCAPILRPGSTPRRPVRAIVVAAARPVGKITITTKHEIGHVLGLDHDDEPQEIMSTRPELRIPMYERRIEIWETVLAAHDDASNGTLLFAHATSTWSDRNYEASEAAFRAAEAEYAAALARFREAREGIEEFAGDPRVETVDLEGLRRHLDRLVERMRLAESIASAMAAASAAAAVDDRTTVDERLSAANERIDEFNAIDSPELRDVAIALGLVRGFDRDDPVADIHEDEIVE